MFDDVTARSPRPRIRWCATIEARTDAVRVLRHQAEMEKAHPNELDEVRRANRTIEHGEASSLSADVIARRAQVYPDDMLSARRRPA
jgi:hypothetical protein